MMLERNGVEKLYGGDRRRDKCKGESHMGQQWRVMIDAPIPSTDSIIHTGTAIIRLTDDGVATSGNYRNFHKTDVGTVGHTISPVTGHPVTTRVLSVTILHLTALLPMPLLRHLYGYADGQCPRYAQRYSGGCRSVCDYSTATDYGSCSPTRDSHP